MRPRAVIFSTLASAATLGVGWAAWAVPHAAQAAGDQANTAQATATPTPSSSSSATASSPATASASASATPSASASSSSSASAAFGGYTGTVTGEAVAFRYGTLQVSVTLDAGTITEVTLLDAPSSGKDAMYTNRAVPVMHDEALAAQSANISLVSGATYTSQAYLESLQSALDQL